MSRGSWEGARQIVRFNWPSYAAAAGVCAACLAAMGVPGAARPAAVVLAATAYLSCASILASHWVYDLSPLADWSWLPGWLPRPAGRWLCVQTGFDSSHGALRDVLPPSAFPAVDLYGAAGVGGASVRRARAENEESARGAAAALPAGRGVCDMIVAPFSLHEIRAADAREDFFRAMSNVLVAGGSLLVVEHARDLSNFLVYGPGFLHFLPAGEWRRCASAAGLSLEKERTITPFVRAFLWRKP